jgi:hypothetical protein
LHPWTDGGTEGVAEIRIPTRRTVMDKKQANRRPDEKPAEQGKGRFETGKPEPGSRMPEFPEGGKRFGQPEGLPVDKPTNDKQAAKPGAWSGGKNILDGDRSDRDSGRPIQLEDDAERESFPAGQRGQADAKRDQGGRPQEGTEDRKHHEAEKTKR